MRQKSTVIYVLVNVPFSQHHLRIDCPSSNVHVGILAKNHGYSYMRLHSDSLLHFPHLLVFLLLCQYNDSFVSMALQQNLISAQLMPQVYLFFIRRYFSTSVKGYIVVSVMTPFSQMTDINCSNPRTWKVFPSSSIFFIFFPGSFKVFIGSWISGSFLSCHCCILELYGSKAHLRNIQYRNQKC